MPLFSDQKQGLKALPHALWNVRVQFQLEFLVAIEMLCKVNTTGGPTIVNDWKV